MNKQILLSLCQRPLMERQIQVGDLVYVSGVIPGRVWGSHGDISGTIIHVNALDWDKTGTVVLEVPERDLTFIATYENAWKSLDQQTRQLLNFPIVVPVPKLKIYKQRYVLQLPSRSE